MLQCSFRTFLAPDTNGGLTLNTGDGNHRDGQSRNPSSAFLRPIIF